MTTFPRAALLPACALLWAACSQETSPSLQNLTNAAQTDESQPAAEIDLALLAGDPARGERVVAQCIVCHALEEGVHRLGPSLHAIVGERAGRIEGFTSTLANRNSGITWTEEDLFEYLRDPATKIPGTISAFPGLPDAQARADVVAYLAAQTKLAARDGE